jgi:thiol-disulfide isomerase/thioredoxin
MSSRPGQIALAAAVAVIAAWGGYVFQQAGQDEAATSSAVRQLLSTVLPDARGTLQALSQWNGKVLVVNFWATWCEPCREEIPGLMRLRQKYSAKNVEIVGIAVDYASNVGDYEKSMGIHYPLLIGGVESIDLARSLGDRQGGLPYTIVLDRTGKLVKAHLGLVHEADLDKKLAELIH